MHISLDDRNWILVIINFDINLEMVNELVKGKQMMVDRNQAPNWKRATGLALLEGTF